MTTVAEALGSRPHGADEPCELRAALIIPMLWVLVTLVFLLMRVIGDPVTAAQGGRLNAQQIAERKHAAGLDRPMLTQYWEYVTGLIHGDFGTTLTDHRPRQSGNPGWSSTLCTDRQRCFRLALPFRRVLSSSGSLA